MNRTHRIEMCFYSHPWTLHMLSRCGVVTAAEQHLLVEVATESSLAVLAERIPKITPGTTALLRQPGKVDFKRIARRLRHVPAPVVLAPKPAVPEELLIASLMVLDIQPVDYEVVMLLVPVARSELAVPLFPMVDRFHVLWDVADYPNRDLLACTETLHAYAELTEARWGGVTLCNHWLRNSDDHGQNRSDFEAAIDEAAL